MARSWDLLFKSDANPAPSQVHRAEILFRLFLDLEEAYKLSRELSSIFTTSKGRIIAFKRLAIWYNKIEKASLKLFNTVSITIQNHYENILNYFDKRITNAPAESFNAKIMAFRSQFRSVRDMSFFLTRLSKIYA